jgi:SHS2 domain-containing protein
MKMTKFYNELEHTADWAIRVWGEEIDALFEHAAGAMFELQGADMAAEPELALEVSCTGVDLEALLVAWLNELLFHSEMQDALWTRFRVRIVQAAPDTPAHHPQWALGAAIGGRRGRGPMAHVKAVTFYKLFVSLVDGRWEATVTFDT